MEYINHYAEILKKKNATLPGIAFDEERAKNEIRHEFMLGMTGRFLAIASVVFDSRTKCYTATLLSSKERIVRVLVTNAVATFLLRHITDSSIDAVAIKMSELTDADTDATCVMVNDCRLLGRHVAPVPEEEV